MSRHLRSANDDDQEELRFPDDEDIDFSDMARQQQQHLGSGAPESNLVEDDCEVFQCEVVSLGRKAYGFVQQNMKQSPEHQHQQQYLQQNNGPHQHGQRYPQQPQQHLREAPVLT